MPNWLPSFDRPRATRDAALPGGKNEPPLPMSPKADEGAWLPGNPDWPALVEFSDGVDDVDDDDELPTSRKSRPKKLVSSAWADPGWNARTSNPGTTRAPTTLENTPRIADLLAGSLQLGPGFLGTGGCPLRALLDPGFRTRRRGKPPGPSSCRLESYRPRSASTFAFPGQPPHGGGRPWEFVGR